MSWSRRNFLATVGLGTSVSTVLNLASQRAIATAQTVQSDSLRSDPEEWTNIRDWFGLDERYIHLAGLLIATHPVPIQAAIEDYRAALNANPAAFLQENNGEFQAVVRLQAAAYMGVQPNDLAITDSTTMGTALVINGLEIRPDQEMLTTEFDYYSTHESLKYKAARSGASVRNIPLYQEIQSVSADEMVDTLISAIRSQTRLVTATWVHSSTGLKVPIRQIADRLVEINATRAAADRVLFLVDGVHGFGVEATRVQDLNCDFFTAGTHKWMFGPRGTGILWGNPRSQAAVSPTIPTFTRRSGWGGWMTPGGFKSFEHLWAMAQAFEFQQQLGASQVAERIQGLSQQLKAELAKMAHITLYTPMDSTLSAGIVCFDVEGMRPQEVVQELQKRNVIASTTPYSPSYARLTPGIYNTAEEIEQTLRLIHELG
jgi:isopenicillin-N epimerase